MSYKFHVLALSILFAVSASAQSSAPQPSAPSIFTNDSVAGFVQARYDDPGNEYDSPGASLQRAFVKANLGLGKACRLAAAYDVRMRAPSDETTFNELNAACEWRGLSAVIGRQPTLLGLSGETQYETPLIDIPLHLHRSDPSTQTGVALGYARTFGSVQLSLRGGAFDGPPLYDPYTGEEASGMNTQFSAAARMPLGRGTVSASVARRSMNDDQIIPLYEYDPETGEQFPVGELRYRDRETRISVGYALGPVRAEVGSTSSSMPGGQAQRVDWANVSGRVGRRTIATAGVERFADGVEFGDARFYTLGASHDLSRAVRLRGQVRRITSSGYEDTTYALGLQVHHGIGLRELLGRFRT